MARKNKNLASFDELATSSVLKGVSPKNNDNENINKDINNDINSDVNISVNTNVNNDINNDVNNNDNNNVNTNINNDVNKNVNVAQSPDYLDTLIAGNGKKPATETVLTGIYLEKDISQILNDLAKQGSRGAKSKIVNKALRAIFVEKGLL
ncbi:MAG: hypothetical protein K0S80_1689 [Neobacillus sp.]|nr:hypothetical protein [Neobacillus sp.]